MSIVLLSSTRVYWSNAFEDEHDAPVFSRAAATFAAGVCLLRLGFLGSAQRCTPGRGPRPSISVGVRDFTLSPALRAGAVVSPVHINGNRAGETGQQRAVQSQQRPRAALAVVDAIGGVVDK